jgi:hypothetical protein
MVSHQRDEARLVIKHFMVRILRESAAAGYADDDDPIWREDSSNLPQQGGGTFEMFQDVVEYYSLKFGIAEEQAIGFHDACVQIL